MAGPAGLPGHACAIMPPTSALGGETFWLDVGDGLLAAEQVGQGSPVVLLHGWTLDRQMWALQTLALADRFTLIAIDRRGFGQSTAPPDRSREVGDLAKLADHLDLATFHLVGMSQAGSPAIAYALAHGDRVASLVLQGISLAGIPDHPDASDAIPLAEYARMVREGRLDAMKRHWGTHPLMAGLTGEAASLVAVMLGHYDGRDLLCGAAGPSVGLDSIAALTMPVLAITGDADTPWRRTVTQALAENAALGQAQFLPGAGHLCNLSHPLEFNAAICAFLEQPVAGCCADKRASL